METQLQSFFATHATKLLADDIDGLMSDYTVPMAVYFERSIVPVVGYQRLHEMLWRQRRLLTDLGVIGLRPRVRGYVRSDHGRTHCKVDWTVEKPTGDRLTPIRYFLMPAGDRLKIEMVEYSVAIPDRMRPRDATHVA